MYFLTIRKTDKEDISQADKMLVGIHYQNKRANHSRKAAKRKQCHERRQEEKLEGAAEPQMSHFVTGGQSFSPSAVMGLAQLKGGQEGT